MPLSPYDFEKYKDEVFDDELIEEAMNRLQKIYRKMALWIKKHKPIKKCPECGYEDLKYRHDGILCKRCKHLKEVEVPPSNKGGVPNNRSLEGLIKEVFGQRMLEAKRKSKPSKDQLDDLPFEVDNFDSGEYTESQVNYLKNRYNTLIEENRVNNEVDRFYIRSMVIRELEIMRLERLKATKPKSVDSNELKKQYDIYNKLSSKVKADKASRDDDDEQAFYDDMDKTLEDSDIRKIIEEYQNSKKEREEYLEKSKQRREEVGNPF
ncbi:MAG: hypothetical protein ACOCRO_10480 [Halanaerobiales bacterium]